MPEIHSFESSGEAYNASQTRESISDGDLLLVPSEKSVAILFKAWPTLAAGSKGDAFHTINDDDFGSEAEAWYALEYGGYITSYLLAQTLLNEDGSLTDAGEAAVAASEARDAAEHEAFMKSIGF